MKNKGMIDQNIDGQSEDLELPFFNLAIIAIATNKFSSNNKLGEGDYGLVYKPKQDLISWFKELHRSRNGEGSKVDDGEKVVIYLG
ncbi:receptor-like serine/threonine-protein kinase sd1-8 [Quercus suber]|uniref:Receptor-like serine/threonine-protein kinase sd1-8 n=1 Tax=Quercus suber TaxID=58331 RepID=A0AAW0L552_QUESU